MKNLLMVVFGIFGFSTIIGGLSKDVLATGTTSSSIDPSIVNNLQINQLNNGNVSVTSSVDNIDSSLVQVGAAGNVLDLSGNIQNSSFLMQNTGNVSVSAQISNVHNSLVQISAVGNSVTTR